MAGLARNPDEDGNTIFEVCSAQFEFASDYYNDFVESQFDSSNVSGVLDLHNVEVGRQVSRMHIYGYHGQSGREGGGQHLGLLK